MRLFAYLDCIIIALRVLWCAVLDDTGLNNIQMECCKVPNPAAGCTPNDTWTTVQECRNNLPNTDIKCIFNIKVGVSALKPDISVTEEIIDTLNSKFIKMVNTSQTTGYNWINSHIWHTKIMTHALEIPVKTGKAIRLEQVAGFCASFCVRTEKYRIIEAD